MSDPVLDASALLALMLGEPGGERLWPHLRRGASIGAVNLSEVMARLSDVGLPDASARGRLSMLALSVVPFDEDLAYRAASLRRITRSGGLSLGDRACLALAEREGATALTADRRWADLDLPITVEVIR